MKTVVDAVNELRGDLNNCAWTKAKWHDSYPFLDFFDSDCTWALHEYDKGCGTIKDFNQCVAEMTEGLFVPLSDLNKRKVSGVETVERGCMVYEIGKRYLSKQGFEVELQGFDGDVFLVRKINHDRAHYTENLKCMSDEIAIGTITKAPLVLEDGAAYQFDLYGGSVATNGIYHKEIDSFVGSAFSTKSKHCTNIIKLVQESK